LLCAWHTGVTDELPATGTAGTAHGAVPDARDEEPRESRWRLGFALGYGLRTNPLVQSDDIPIVVDIDVAWFGDRLFFDNGDLGFTFADNDLATVSLIARVNSDRVFFGKTDTRFVTVDSFGMPLSEAAIFEVPDRRYATELGIEVLMDGSWGQLQMTAHHDVSGTHDGYEAYVDYGYGWRMQRWYVEPSVGVSYKSDALNNYYWGVREDEAGVALQPYVAGDGINVHARFALIYQVSRRWTLSLVGEFERLNDSAAGSPIVANQDIFGYFAGFGFRF
jgi:outer membrane protein